VSRAAGPRAGTPPPPDARTRGVRNPFVVDRIERDRDSHRVVLVMLEPRPWGSDPEQLDQLEEKLNSYLGYVLGGHLVRQYPDYEGMPVRFQLECVASPRVLEEDFLAAARHHCAGEGIELTVVVRTAEELAAR